jgi:hypothetical protein
LQIARQRAQEVVQQILAFSRPTPYACVEVRAGQIVHEAMQLVRPTLPKSIELRVCIGDETSTILADATQLEQVMLNLCANAVDAMRETGGVLKVRLEAVELTPAWVAKHPPLQPGQCTWPHETLLVNSKWEIEERRSFFCKILQNTTSCITMGRMQPYRTLSCGRWWAQIEASRRTDSDRHDHRPQMIP